MASRGQALLRGQAVLRLVLLRYAFVHRRRLYRTARRRPRRGARAFARFVAERMKVHGVGSGAALALINVNWRTIDFSDRLKLDLRGLLLLRLSEVFKATGLFADAELLLRELARRPAFSDLAWLSLGDLLLTQAGWAREFGQYEAIGAALDGYALDDDEAPWRFRTFADARQALLHASAAAPASPHPRLLSLICELGDGRLNAAATAAADFSDRQAAPGWEEQMLMARAALARDHARAARYCHAALHTQATSLPDRGFEHWTTQIVPLCDLDESATESRDGLPACRTELRGTLVRDGKAAAYRRELNFPPVRISRLDEAVVLPPHGMVLARGGLLADTAHVLALNYPVFTPQVRAVSEGHALLCGPPVREQGSTRGGVLIGQNANYYHFLIEELPRLQLTEGHPDYAGSPLIVDEQLKPWQLDLLARLGVGPERQIRRSFEAPLHLADVVVPGRLSGAMLAHPDAVRFIRSRLVPHAEALKPKPGKRLYLARNTFARRGLLNEAEVVDQMSRAGFQTIDPGALSIDQQIELFSDAEVVAGPGGAAFTNLIFAPKDVRALLLTPADVPAESFTSIANAIGQSLTWCAGTGYPRAHHSWIWSIFDFEIEQQDLRKALDAVL